MSKKLYRTDILKQVQNVLAARGQIDKSLQISATQAIAPLSKLNTLEAQAAYICNQRDSSFQELWNTVKRICNGVKVNLDDASSQHEMIDGTCLSEHKTPPVSSKSNACPWSAARFYFCRSGGL
jgi:hypothetical protein